MSYEQFQHDQHFGYIYSHEKIAHVPGVSIYVADVHSDSDCDGPVYFDVTARAFSGSPQEARAHAYAILAAADHADPLGAEKPYEGCPFGRTPQDGCCCQVCQPWLT